MKTGIKLPLLAILAVFAVAGCAGPAEVMRDQPFLDTPVIEPEPRDWAVARLDIVVPETLTVSEANTIKPRADIVWREDAPGDRHAQVQTLFEQALTPVLSQLDGATRVIVHLELTRFHAVTERARYTIGGEHEIEFLMTIFDAETGQSMTGRRPVDLTFRAYGGQQAIEAEAEGITQRVRIMSRLQQWALAEFPRPASSLLQVN
jgi:hypothetical protein